MRHRTLSATASRSVASKRTLTEITLVLWSSDTEWLYRPVLQNGCTHLCYSGCILLCYRTAVAACVTEWLYPPVLQNGCSLLRYRVAVPICVTEWLYQHVLQSGCTHLRYRVDVSVLQDHQFKQIPTVDQLAIHFGLDGNMIHKDSDEARRQMARDTGIQESTFSQPVSHPAYPFLRQTATNACR